MKSRKPLPEELFFSRTADFLNTYLPSICRKSQNTIETYRSALSVFRRYLHDIRHISIVDFRYADCTRSLILDFMDYMKDKGVKAATCNNRLTAIRVYLLYSADCDITVQPVINQVSRIPLLKEPKKLKDIIGEKELAALLRSTPSTKIGIRDQMIMVLLYDTAIRVSELTGLKLQDICTASSSPYIRIHGKGNKERIVVIAKQTVQHLSRYMRYYHPDQSDKNRYLFYTVIKGHEDRMSTGNVERILNKYAESIRKDYPDLPDRIYPHMFRRTRATNLYQDGVELELVSRILGHSSTETTRIYASPSLEMMSEAMNHKTADLEEKPLWKCNEDELARLCGLK